MANYRIGIVGFGKIARDQHAPAIAASLEFELVAVSNMACGNAPAGVQSFVTNKVLWRDSRGSAPLWGR